MRSLSSLLLGGLLTLTAGGAQAVVINKIVATVDGEPVTMYQLKRFTERNIRGRELKTGDRELLLDALITEQLVAKEVAEKGIIVRDEDVQRYIDSIKARNNIDDMQLEQALAAQGLSVESYRTQVREDLQRQQLITREIRSKVSITPEEVRRYYEAHQSEFGTKESGIQVSHIVFALPLDAPADRVAALTAKAEEARARLESGADFAELARQISEDPSARDGGLLGWFKPGELLDEMDAAVAKLNVGEVSQPVRTKMGLHLVKLDARRGTDADDLDTAVAEQIKDKLYAQALEERFQKWLAEDLKKRHHIVIR